MSNDMNASVVISTAESEAGLRKLDSAAKDLDKTLQNLHKSLQNGQGDLDKVTSSMTALTRANAALIRSEQDRAKATVLAAKADGQVIVNQTKRQKSANDTAIAEAKVAKIRQTSLASGLSTAATSTRRDAESRVRMAANEALGQARVTSELTRTAIAQQNLATATIRTGSASEMAAARTDRLAAGSHKAASGTLALNDSLSNSRYLLYDVGQTYTVLAAALQVIPVATAAVAIAYEKDFAQVIRTNDTLAQGNGFAVLRDDLKQLATEIPLTFAEFSNIATIGGQLGIAGQDVSTFTETVARFGAASNVSLDTAATAFGRLQNSYDPMREDANFFNKVGSAIAFVGVKSAATEAEIIAVNNQISAAGATFGFAAHEIVGLSGALASVRIRPELARGAFQRIMLGLSRAADEGSEAFNKFGKYTGLAAEESQALFKSDPSAFFYKYIGGIKGAIKETGSASAVLDDIGAKNVFDKQFILGLSNGYREFGDSLGNASKAFNEGTFLNESTQGVFDTMDSKIKRISSAIKNLADTMAKGSLGEGSGLVAIADVLLSITGAVDRFAAATPAFTAFLNVVLGLGSAIGILLAFKAAQAFMLAGLVGFQQVLGKGTLAAGLTAKGILQQIAVTMLMAKGATDAQSQALVRQVGAYKAMGIAAATSAAMVKAGTLAGMGGVSDAAATTTTKLGGLAAGFGAAGRGALAMAGGPFGAAILALGAISLGFIQVEEKANSAGEAIGRAMKNGAEAAKVEIGNQLTDRKVELTDNIWMGNLGKNVREIAKEVDISFDSMVKSIYKGEGAAKAFQVVLDNLGRSKGAKDYADALSKGLISTGQDQQIKFLAENVKSLGDRSSKTQADVKAVDKAAGVLGDTAAGAAPDVDGIAAAIEGAGDESETASQKLDKFLASIFGLADASAGTQAALQALGEGLANSADFGPGSEGGRENLSNFQDALKAAAQEQQILIETTGKSTQQASADYIAFVEGLVGEMVSRGVDPTNVTALADQAKGYFSNAMASGNQPQIELDGQKAIDQARATYNTVQQEAAGLDVSVKLKADDSEAVAKVGGVEAYAAAATAEPNTFILGANADGAIQNAGLAEGYMRDVAGVPYQATINADTSPAIAGLQALQSFAHSVLTAIQWAINDVNGSVKSAASAEIGNVRAGTAKTAAPKSRSVSAPSMPKIAAPAQVNAAPKTPNFAALGDGYDKVRAAADKAGDAGKKAGNDMANGIDDATQAAEDYANRLKQGFSAAFEKQYGVQKATDDYYSALNAINKKRDEELAQIDDLISKQKELNDEKAEELINARKAGIEKDISLKYGEVDRAADYAQQEQEALNAADAKHKDIQANNAQIVSLRAGIGELNGYSEAAIANREAIRNLEQKMLDMVVAYAATGASTEQVRAYAQRLTAQFQTDAGQVWNNRVAIDGLTGNMWRYIDVVNRVPYHKPTVVTADVGGAIGNVNAFNGAADWAARPRTMHMNADLNTDAYNRKMRAIQAQIVGGGMADDPSMTAFRPGTFRPVYNTGGMVQGFSGGGMVPGKAPSNLSVDNMFASVDGRGIVGIQSEEFIMQKRAVDFWGSDFMNAINSMKMPAFSGGGAVGGRNSSGSNSSGPVLVELTAENLQAILRLAERDINLFAGVEQIASSANEGNRILATKGVK